MPKPAPIAQASYIYYPMNDEVWSVTFAFLVITAVLYHVFSRVLSSPSISHWFTAYRSNIPTELDTLSRAFMDVINIITSHGLPRILQRPSVQILIIAWTLLSFFLGTAYSTKLMSVLARPLFTKAVDTVHDFIEKGEIHRTLIMMYILEILFCISRIGLFWGEFGDRASMKNDLMASGNDEYIELAHRMTVERDLDERHENIETGNYARFVKASKRIILLYN